MKTFFILALAIASIVATSCRRDTFDFASESDLADNRYHGDDVAQAQQTLEHFIAQSELYEVQARKTKRKNFNWIVGMACLKLSSIYEINGDKNGHNVYVDKAISYFDRDPRMASDPIYYTDRKLALADLLNKIETHRKPKWKQKFPSK